MHNCSWFLGYEKIKIVTLKIYVRKREREGVCVEVRKANFQDLVLSSTRRAPENKLRMSSLVVSGLIY